MNQWADKVEVIAKTDKAILVKYEDLEEWIAESLIHDDSEIWRNSNVGDEGILVIPEWLAENKGFI